MLERFPKFYEEFACLGGDCPHTCCAQWEVVLDPDTAERYRALSGELGERLRAIMTVDGDGDVCFPLNGGRCPFLDHENLCEIHRTLGQEATSVTCQEHPRFIEDYGPFREITLSASCPEANRLLFEGDGPMAFGCRITEEETEEGDPWLTGLVPLRQTMLHILGDGTRPIYDRLGDFLAMAEAAQEQLEQEELKAVATLDLTQVRHRTPEPGAGIFPEGLSFLKTLEQMEEDWEELLDRAARAQLPPRQDHQLQRVAEYAAFRYLLKCVNDGDLLGRAQLCVFLTLAAERIGAVIGIPEALRRLSCEIEHSDNNLEALLQAFWTHGALSLENCFHQVYIK